MSEHKKDPIVEQIETDAFKEAMKQIGSSTPCYEKGYIKGATVQDKLATNRTVDLVIEINSNIIANLTQQYIDSNDADKRIAFAAATETLERHSEQMNKLK